MSELTKIERSELEELRSYKSKVSNRYRRNWARMSIMLEKAKKSGIVVSEKEIEERLITMKRK